MCDVKKFIGDEDDIIYLDNASTTKITDGSKDIVGLIFEKLWQNPSGLYEESKKTNQLLEVCKEEIRESIGANIEDAIIFTNSGSASNNLCLDIDNFNILYDPTSHSSIIDKVKYYKDKNLFNDRIYSLVVDRQGVIDGEHLFNMLFYIGVNFNDKDIVVSVNVANNENGTIQDIKFIKGQIDTVKRRLLKESGIDINIYLHGDCTQLIADRSINVKELGLDMMTLSGHKIGCPGGIGLCYVKHELIKKIKPIIFGEQQYGLYGGTENLAYIVLLANAIVDYNYNNNGFIVNEQQQNDIDKKFYDVHGDVKNIQLKLFNKIKQNIHGVHLVGNNIGDFRLGNHLSLLFDGIDSESLVNYLDLYGIKCSTGSACNSFNKEPSFVLRQMGYSDEECYQVVRFTIGKDINESNFDEVSDRLINTIKNFKDMY